MADQPFFLYTVKAGDTFSGLGKRFFGDPAKQPYLNTPKTLRVGFRLQVPCRWYVTQPGDNLATIATQMLGDPGRWRRIHEANKAKLPDPNNVPTRLKLAVPDESAARHMFQQEQPEQQPEREERGPSQFVWHPEDSIIS